MYEGESDNDNRKQNKYMCATINQQDTKSNTNLNSNPTSTEQHSLVSNQRNVVTRPTYPETMLLHRFCCFSLSLSLCRFEGLRVWCGCCSRGSGFETASHNATSTGGRCPKQHGVTSDASSRRRGKRWRGQSATSIRWRHRGALRMRRWVAHRRWPRDTRRRCAL